MSDTPTPDPHKVQISNSTVAMIQESVALFIEIEPELRALPARYAGLVAKAAKAMRREKEAEDRFRSDLHAAGFSPEQVSEVSDSIYNIVVTLTGGLRLSELLHSVSAAFDPDLMDQFVRADLDSGILDPPVFEELPLAGSEEVLDELRTTVKRCAVGRPAWIPGPDGTRIETVDHHADWAGWGWPDLVAAADRLDCLTVESSQPHRETTDGIWARITLDGEPFTVLAGSVSGSVFPGWGDE